MNTWEGGFSTSLADGTLRLSLLMPLGNAMLYLQITVHCKAAIEVFVVFSWGRGVHLVSLGKFSLYPSLPCVS